MSMNHQDKLSLYGYGFQLKIITLLMTDRNFINQIADILLPDYFESEANKWVVDTIKKYFMKYKYNPTIEALKVYVEDIDNDILKATVVDSLKESYRYVDATDLEFVKEKTLDFCKNQHLKSAILTSVDLLQAGEYEKIKQLVDKAMTVGADPDIGHDYLKEFESRMSESSRQTVATGWDVIDEITDGGLGAGELGVVIAPAGIGKSWGLISIGAAAVQVGKTVVHYTLELNENYVGLRYDSKFTGIPSQNLKYHKDEVIKKLSSISGRLIIKSYPTKVAGIQTLMSHVEKMKLLGTQPDLIIVDYADLLRGTGGKSDEKRHILDNIYEELRGMGGELNVPVWTASQANRSSLEEDVIEANKVSDSYGKIMISDFVMSLSRKVEDKLANTARWHVIKNRFGVDGITYPSDMNASTGLIRIYDSSSQGGREQKEKMNKSSEFVRKSLAKKYEEMG